MFSIQYICAMSFSFIAFVYVVFPLYMVWSLDCDAWNSIILWFGFLNGSQTTHWKWEKKSNKPKSKWKFEWLKWLFYGADDFHLFICDALFLAVCCLKNWFSDWIIWFHLLWKCSHSRVPFRFYSNSRILKMTKWIVNAYFWVRKTKYHTEPTHVLELLLLLCLSISVWKWNEMESFIILMLHLTWFEMRKK